MMIKKKLFIREAKNNNKFYVEAVKSLDITPPDFVHKTTSGYNIGYYFYKGAEDRYGGILTKETRSEAPNFLRKLLNLCKDNDIPVLKSGIRNSTNRHPIAGYIDCVIAYVVVPFGEFVNAEKVRNTPVKQQTLVNLSSKQTKDLFRIWDDETGTMEEFVELALSSGYTPDQIVSFYWKNRDNFDYLDYDEGETIEDFRKYVMNFV